jgi:hypothetical protein
MLVLKVTRHGRDGTAGWQQKTKTASGVQHMVDDSKTTMPTDEEILDLFGGVAPNIVRTPEMEAYLKWHLEYVEREGHQP